MVSVKSRFIFRDILYLFILFSLLSGCGKQVSASESHNIQLAITKFYQNDPEWGSDKIGSTSYNLKSSGCLVSLVAVVLDQLGYQVTPGSLNRQFNQNGIYTEEGFIYWDYIKKIYPSVTSLLYNHTVSADFVLEVLKKGRLPIVKIKSVETGGVHWVLIKGIEKEAYVIFDPYKRKNSLPDKLSFHGKILSLRILFQEEKEG